MMNRLLDMTGITLCVLMVAAPLALSGYLGWLACTAPSLTDGLIIAVPALQCAVIAAMLGMLSLGFARERFD